MNLRRRVVFGLLVLVFSSLVFLVLSVFLLPHSLVKSHVCSTPLSGPLLPEICTTNNMHISTHGPLSSSSNVPLYDTPPKATGYEKTLNIATSIFVVSLTRRTDRRRIMDTLKEALHLDWQYFDALDKNDPLVDSVLDSVAKMRAKASSSSSSFKFKWPDISNTLENAHLVSLGIDTEVLGLSPSIVHPDADEPPLCAVDDNTIPTYANASSVPFHMKLSRGMIACWYSHVRLMAEIVRQTSHIRQDTWDGREGVTIVFEDDIDVEWDLRQRLEKMWADLPRDWDIIMLGHCWSNESTNPRLNPSSPLHPSHNPKCTHGYVLSPFGARRLLTHLTYPPFAFSRALDQAVAHLIWTNRIRSFSVVPSIVVQRRCPPILHSTLDRDSDNPTSVESEPEPEPELRSRCPYYNLAAMGGEAGDSDIWMNEGRKGSRWRDELENSALERIWKGEMRWFE